MGIFVRAVNDNVVSVKRDAMVTFRLPKTHDVPGDIFVLADVKTFQVAIATTVDGCQSKSTKRLNS